MGQILQALVYDRLQADRVARNATVALLAPEPDLVVLESEVSPLRWPALSNGHVPAALLSQTLLAWASRASKRPPRGPPKGLPKGPPKGPPKAPTTGPMPAGPTPAGPTPAGQAPTAQAQAPAGQAPTAQAQAGPAANGTATAMPRTAAAPTHGKPAPLRKRLLGGSR